MAQTTNYSRIDRWIHNLAFDQNGLQVMMADLENSLFADRWADVPAERPIFITSLPRAGTTILLEALHRLPGLASHTYRDMPFVLTPVLWARLSRGFRRRSPSRERAHGDGLQVNEDSPEAFEEVLWRKHFGHKYTEDHVELWHVEDADAVFTEFFCEHMKKLVALRLPSSLEKGRYLSKNNGNIARIELLRSMFADASIVVLSRHPIEHAISLWLQHGNFKARHTDDPFVRKYMADIGHYDFGENHKPIRFDGLKELIRDRTPDAAEYWLAYWISCFDHLAAQDDITFVSYESLCNQGARGLSRLCEHLEVKADRDEIAHAASIFRPPPTDRRDTACLSDDLTKRAIEIHNRLEQRCVLRN